MVNNSSVKDQNIIKLALSTQQKICKKIGRYSVHGKLLTDALEAPAVIVCKRSSVFSIIDDIDSICTSAADANNAVDYQFETSGTSKEVSSSTVKNKIKVYTFAIIFDKVKISFCMTTCVIANSSYMNVAVEPVIENI